MVSKIPISKAFTDGVIITEIKIRAVGAWPTIIIILRDVVIRRFGLTGCLRPEDVSNDEKLSRTIKNYSS